MAMDQSDVKALRSDALGPAEIEAKAETLAVGKAGMAGAKCFVLAMLAGAFIAFGATYSCVPGRLGGAVRRSAHGRRHLLQLGPGARAVLRS